MDEQTQKFTNDYIEWAKEASRRIEQINRYVRALELRVEISEKMIDLMSKRQDYQADKLLEMRGKNE